MDHQRLRHIDDAPPCRFDPPAEIQFLAIHEEILVKRAIVTGYPHSLQRLTPGQHSRPPEPIDIMAKGMGPIKHMHVAHPRVVRPPPPKPGAFHKTGERSGKTA